MAGNLTAQVRNIAEVATAIAGGDLVPQDHGRRPRRNPAAQRNPQYDGRSAQPLCRRGDACGARSRHRRPARRPGQRARRRRHLEGLDRQRQLDGRQPDRPGPQHRRGDDGGGQGRPLQKNHGRRQRRNSRTEEHHQHHGRSAQRLRFGSDARGARSRHRRQVRRSGPGARSRRHLEGSHRQRQLHGVQPDRSGPQHRRGRDRDRRRRSVEEDHRRRARRNPAAQGHPEYDGRAASLVRRRSDARGARGRHRRPAGRPGCGARRRRHLEGSDRQRQPAGGQPHHASPQHRRSHHRRGARRPVAQDHGGREGRNSRTEEHHQYDGRPAQRASPAKSPAWRARSAPKASSAARRRCPASPAPGRI